MSETVRDVIMTAIIIAVVVGAAWYSSGCTYGVDLTVGVKLDDKCLLTFPSCEGSQYRCENVDGEVQLGCELACVAGRTLTCDPDGPTCAQRLGSGEQWVPVVCVTRDE